MKFPFYVPFQKNSGPSEISQKQTAAEPSFAESRWFETVLNTLSEGVVIVDKNLRIWAVNRKAQELFEVDPPREDLSLLEGLRSTEVEALARQALRENRMIEQELQLYTGETPRYLRVRAAPLISGGEPHSIREGLALALTEYTRLHNLEQVRKDFAANVSHELRTPIQLVRGYAETLLDSSLEDYPQIRRGLGIILKNAQRMEQLTSDLLTLVSLEEGDDFSQAMKETSVYPLLQEALDAVEPSARQKQITFSLACPERLKAVLYGPFIVQGLINLLDNGIKYSYEQSKIGVFADIQDGELVIEVRDKGIGIPPNHLERIFERFYRVDPARSRSQGGSGLGLAIVRHIALVHRGSVEAESHAGEGSVFRIRLPCQKFS
ncbi:MAG: PAS domain-containing protein [Treponema sp.]|jgi:two-component system phosphate regulon sensor histidine kinase PhoR|nr:PAS domain-containing protein [Treponema sp.]